MQGPQGIGKTTITNELRESLSCPPNSLRVSVLSMDDFYLPYDGLKSTAEKYPNNWLLSGRGHPGTHDLDLLHLTLTSLSVINGEATAPVETPVFDKSLFDGYGDRSSSKLTVAAPLDVVLLEGWCMGFHHLSHE
ncbi:uncharacterized protein EI90DRAFT_716264, partial [Cantharellus anzutake]|uniref:uncharacterized protein n=2 Tax=Cantharellus anzutake TaxID=1750568 RepID=UPI0019046721